MQERAVTSIRAVYGRVYYDYHKTKSNVLDSSRESWVPSGVRQSLGDDAFHNVIGVDLDSPHVTDDSLASLKHLCGLTRVYIGECSITKRGLKELQSVPSLQELYLSCSCVDDDALAILARCPHLKLLEIQRCNVTDAGLTSLQGSASLRTLILVDVEVTEDGVSKLRKKLPTCNIDY
jgi:hypothetical protein